MIEEKYADRVLFTHVIFHDERERETRSDEIKIRSVVWFCVKARKFEMFTLDSIFGGRVASIGLGFSKTRLSHVEIFSDPK